MFCTEGRTPLGALERTIDDLVMLAFPEQEILRPFPQVDLTGQLETYQKQKQISRSIFDDIIRFCGSLALTSPTGLTLKVEVDMLEGTFGNPELARKLYKFPSHINYFFVQTELFYVSTLFWDRFARDVYINHYQEIFDGDEAPEILDLIADQLRPFEGWGLSILDCHVPRSAAELMRFKSLWEPQETSTTPRGTLANLNVEACVLKVFPNGKDATWPEVMKQVGYDRRTIIRAMLKLGSYEAWNPTEQS